MAIKLISFAPNQTGRTAHVSARIVQARQRKVRRSVGAEPAAKSSISQPPRNSVNTATARINPALSIQLNPIVLPIFCKFMMCLPDDLLNNAAFCNSLLDQPEPAGICSGCRLLPPARVKCELPNRVFSREVQTTCADKRVQP
jgi:hypothetical protein